LTSRQGRRVLDGYDRRITRSWIFHRRFPQTLWLQQKVWRQLRGQRYNRVYVFETKPFYRRWLKGLAPAYLGLDAVRSDAHYCDRCLDLVAQSVVAPPPRGWVTLPVSEAGLAKARALLLDHGVQPSDFLVGLHPTFSGSSRFSLRDRKGMHHRHWPPQSFARLAILLRERAPAERSQVRIVVDALPDERPLVEPIVQQSAGVITLLMAPPDFERYKGLLQCLDVLVTPNTGPMHIAAAVGTPVVALFSDWSIADCGPFVPADRYEALSAENTETPERGLAAIEPQQVCEAVMRLTDRDSGA
jgi:ADP-heptose:LPS heptosyltransferase